MTPEERQLVVDLFERIAALENEPRDPEAEQAIRAGLAKAPHALYALVQSVLVQDEALRQADARIQELEAALQGGPQPGQSKGFLDNMRETLFGRDEPRGSVPQVRPAGEPMGAPPQYRTGSSAWNTGMPPQPMPGGYSQEPSGRGGSFLGTAAAAAAGMIGGGLLLDGIRGMLGGQRHGPFAGTFDDVSAGGGSRAPWAGGSEGSGDLGRQAGLDDISRGRSTGLFDTGDDDRSRGAGLFDTAENEGDGEDVDIDDDFDADTGSDTDTA